MLRAARTAAGARRGDEAGHLVDAALPLDRQQVAGKLPPKHGVGRAAQVAVAGGDKLLLAVLDEPEADFRVGERDVQHSLTDIAALARVLFQELHPGGGIIKQVVDRDCRAAAARAGLDFSAFPSFDAVKAGELILVGLGQQFHPGDACDGGKRFAAETEGVDVGEIFGRSDLARRMADEGVLDRFSLDAAAVVRNLQLFDAAAADREGDLACAGVDRIFQQFFRDRSRPLDHLARRNQLGRVFIQNVNFGHRNLVNSN